MSRAHSPLQAITLLPELNVIVFAALLNGPWEFLQAPLFDRMAQAPHWEATKVCVAATLGDAVILLLSYWAVAAVWGCRRWVVRPKAAMLALFVALGVVITLVIEHLALAGLWSANWAYSPRMPVLPIVGVGLSPLLQWLVVPPLVAWFVRRQLAGQPAAEDAHSRLIVNRRAARLSDRGSSGCRGT